MEHSLLKISDIELGALELQRMYAARGYRKFKMSHFEELEFYTQNRSFLEDDRITAFSDPSGKVLALRPDVTLSIVKNATGREKVYYGEYVYRVAKNDSVLDEIMQVGLEQIGDLDGYAVGEVVWLAARSLAALSDDYVLDVSHMGLLAALLGETGADEVAKEQAVRCIAGKNAHDAAAALTAGGASREAAEALLAAATMSGPFGEMLPKIRALFTNPSAEVQGYLSELEGLARLMAEAGMADRLRFDLSVTSDMSYYNGIVFSGYLRGVPFRVLSGGRYDPLLEKLGKPGSAIGFAVYLGKLEQYVEPLPTGADALLTYDPRTPPELVMRRAQQIAEDCDSILVTSEDAPEGDYRLSLYLDKEGGLSNA